MQMTNDEMRAWIEDPNEYAAAEDETDADDRKILPFSVRNTGPSFTRRLLFVVWTLLANTARPLSFLLLSVVQSHWGVCSGAHDQWVGHQV